MTAVQERAEPRDTAPARPDRMPRLRGIRPPAWLTRHLTSLYVLVPLLAVVGTANLWNLQGWPARIDDDEGTYVSEAWAIIVPHHLSFYTYWYDHPPLGWILMGAYIWVTRGFSRYPSAVMAGREFMWVVTLVSCVLLYLLARRLLLSRPAAGAAVLLFGLSPLAIFYHRMVFLDNISTMWLLAAFCLAASPRRSLAAATGSGAAFAVACLSKETTIVAWPVVIWLLWQHSDARTRRWNLSVSVTTCALILLGYPLYAGLRGELLPGPGHVSLGHSIWWQLVSRPSSGSLLSVDSAAFGLVRTWFMLDPWLLGGGLAAALIGVAVRRLRPLAAGLLLQTALLAKPGYVPFMYVTAMLPAAALLMAAVPDAWLRWARARLRASPGPHPAGRAGYVLALAAITGLAGVIAPQWAASLVRQSHVDGDAGSLAATAWVNQNLGHGQLVVVDGYLWPDITLHGRATPLFCPHVNGDPWVRRHLLQHGWKSINYIVLESSSTCLEKSSDLPTLLLAMAHSRVVRTFAGGLVARQVIDGTSARTVRPARYSRQCRFRAELCRNPVRPGSVHRARRLRERRRPAWQRLHRDRMCPHWSARTLVRPDGDASQSGHVIAARGLVEHRCWDRRLPLRLRPPARARRLRIG